MFVVTADDIGRKNTMDYADDFYGYNGYGFGENYDGVLLLVSMEDRDWWMSTSGYGITAITDAGIEYISDKFLSDLSDGDYAGAFSTYAELCDEFFTQAENRGSRMMSVICQKSRSILHGAWPVLWLSVMWWQRL